MKLSKLSFLVALGLFASSIFPGCSAEEKNVSNPLPTPSGITGEIRLRSGEEGDISNTRIAVHRDLKQKIGEHSKPRRIISERLSNLMQVSIKLLTNLKKWKVGNLLAKV